MWHTACRFLLNCLTWYFECWLPPWSADRCVMHILVTFALLHYNALLILKNCRSYPEDFCPTRTSIFFLLPTPFYIEGIFYKPDSVFFALTFPSVELSLASTFHDLELPHVF